MTLPELDIAPRTKGRAVRQVILEPAGELTAADLALLASERGIKPAGILVLRERHHALARALAGGMSNAEASIITGYDPSRISILKGQELFKQLIEDYKAIGAGFTADFVERTSVLSLAVVDSLMDDLENEEKPLSVATKLEIAKFAADRTGNGPSTKTQNVNVNINLGDRLRAARERANAAMRPVEPEEPLLLDVTPLKTSTG